jgi:hypothetical protein
MTDLATLQAELRNFIAKERGEVQFPFASPQSQAKPSDSSQVKSRDQAEPQGTEKDHNTYTRAKVSPDNSTSYPDASSCKTFLYQPCGSPIEYGPDSPLGEYHIGLSSLAASATTCDFCAGIYNGIQREDKFWKLVQRTNGYQNELTLREDIKDGKCRIKLNIRFSVVDSIVKVNPCQERNFYKYLGLFAKPGR